MKRYLILLFISWASIAQTPQAFKYQAVVRNNNGVLLMGKNISVRIGILMDGIEGESVFLETHNVTTSSTGLINLEIGRGTNVLGSLEGINWGSGDFFIKLEVDQNGGSSFELVGVSQLLSVPYALYAEKSGDEKWTEDGNNNIIRHDGSVGIGESNPKARLDIAGNSDLNILNLSNTNNSLGINAFVSSNTDFHGSALIGRRSRGTYAMPSTVAANDRITGIYGSIYADGNYQNSSAIHMYVGANPGSGSYPSNIRFETTNTNETIRMERMRIAENGNVGIGTTNPNAKLQVENGDIYLSNIGSGVVTKSPDGNCWRLTVDNSGNIVATSITCP